MKTTKYNNRDLWHLRLLFKHKYKNVIYEKDDIIRIYLRHSNNSANTFYLKFEFSNKKDDSVMILRTHFVFISHSDGIKLQKKLTT